MNRTWNHFILAVLFLLTAAAGTCVAETAESATLNSEEAWRRLAAGNQRYVRGRATHPHQGAKWRLQVAKDQHPFAVILGCADSRVPPEVIFDQGIGDLFIIRVAGNIVDDDVLGSIEYAVEHLGTKLVVVLGHERCGAVSAAVSGGHEAGHIERLLEAIRPAVDQARTLPGDSVDNAVRANVIRVVGQLKASEPLLHDRNEHSGVKIVGARYDLDTGRIEELGQ